MTNLSAPIGAQNQRPNMSDYVTTAKAASGADLTASDVGNLFWDLISGGQLSNTQMADYNNRLNEWNYLQYQSPEALARQYEEAGLNRNFSQQGPSGNIQSAASANLGNSGIANSIRLFSGINTLLTAVAQGVNITSDILSIPKDQAYKTWRNLLASQNVDIASSKALSVLSKAMYDSVYYGGRKYELNDEGQWMFSEDRMNTPALTQAGLRNDVMELMKGLRKYELDKIKPKDLDLLEQRIRQVGASAGLSEKTLATFDQYKVLPLLLGFIKLFM